MNNHHDFNTEVAQRIGESRDNDKLRSRAKCFLEESICAKYSYNFFSLGRPIIQYPQDMIAVQELIWSIRPDCIVETGIAHGGSLIMSAAMLALLDYCDAADAGEDFDVQKSRRKVVGLDIEIRPHNKAALEAHPLFHKLDMVEGNSIDDEIISQIYDRVQGYEKILVLLDSNHTHDHVLAELEAYAPLVSQGSYCVVFDTLIEDLPDSTFPDRPWGVGNNPKTAVREYLRLCEGEGRRARDGKPLHFEVDTNIESKILITAAPEGYLKRLRECPLSP
ncbi:MAG: cephalosporin hydroxylase [Dethiosulfovibrio peptidovorans]|nr:MAG: cephalosporin hydroxylase [Dethiosulfovibrio peptidovorans]